MYRFLQTDLRKFRILLLLPFLVAHLVFYLSLPFSLDDSFLSVRNPVQCTTHSPGAETVETLQVVKTKSPAKAIANAAFYLVIADRALRPAPEPAVVVYRYSPAHWVAAFHPPRLFTNRAPPA